MKLFKRKPNIYMQFQASNKMYLGFNVKTWFGAHFPKEHVCILTKDEGWIPIETIMNKILLIGLKRHSLSNINDTRDPIKHLDFIIELFPKIIEVCEAVDEYKMYLFNLAFRDPLAQMHKTLNEKHITITESLKEMKQNYPNVFERILVLLKSLGLMIFNWKKIVTDPFDLNMFNEELDYTVTQTIVDPSQKLTNYEIIVDHISYLLHVSFVSITEALTEYVDDDGNVNFSSNADMGKYNKIVNALEKLEGYTDKLTKIYGYDNLLRDVGKIMRPELVVEHNKLTHVTTLWITEIYAKYMSERYNKEYKTVLECANKNMANYKFDELKIA